MSLKGLPLKIKKCQKKTTALHLRYGEGTPAERGGRRGRRHGGNATGAHTLALGPHARVSHTCAAVLPCPRGALALWRSAHRAAAASGCGGRVRVWAAGGSGRC
jgi:hypothetical protein